jgi:hypothetical protein
VDWRQGRGLGNSLPLCKRYQVGSAHRAMSVAMGRVGMRGRREHHAESTRQTHQSIDDRNGVHPSRWDHTLLLLLVFST